MFALKLNTRKIIDYLKQRRVKNIKSKLINWLYNKCPAVYTCSICVTYFVHIVILSLYMKYYGRSHTYMLIY